MTRSDTALLVNRARLGFKWSEPGNTTGIDTDGEGSVLRGLSWAAALYALVGAVAFVGWRVIAN